MRAPVFWSQPRPNWLAHLLRPLGMLYGMVTANRMDRTGENASLPVICIGNFSVGGTGKTPTAIAIAQALKAQGHKPVFLTRGYAGRLPGPLLVDASVHTADDIGDEPLLLARHAPVVIARDRAAGARLIAQLNASENTAGQTHDMADVIVMDDGLQNPALRKTFALAVVDGAVGFGNGLCLPAGPLRAPLARQFRHVQGLLLVGEGKAGEYAAQLAEQAGKPVFRASLAPDPAIAASLRGERVLAFAGIGRPEKFFDTLGALGAEVVATRPFADHAPLTSEDIASLLATASQQGLQLVTTEKDAARLAHQPEAAQLRAQTIVLPVTLSIMQEGSALHKQLAKLMD